MSEHEQIIACRRYNEHQYKLGEILAENAEFRIIIDDMLLVEKEQVRENARLRKAILDFGNADEGFDWAVLARIEKLETALKEIADSGVLDYDLGLALRIEEALK